MARLRQILNGPDKWSLLASLGEEETHRPVTFHTDDENNQKVKVVITDLGKRRNGAWTFSGEIWSEEPGNPCFVRVSGTYSLKKRNGNIRF